MTFFSKFYSLPLDILLQNTPELDSASAASFSLGPKICALAAEPAIWRHIDVDIQPNGVVGRRYTQLFRYGTPRRWDMVRSVSADMSSFTQYPLLQLLEYTTSKGLQSLEISAVHRHAEYFPIDDFGVGLLRYPFDLRFSSLTHVRQCESVYIIAIIPYLCFLAPELSSLDFRIEDHPHDPLGFNTSSYPPIPPYDLPKPNCPK